MSPWVKVVNVLAIKLPSHLKDYFGTAKYQFV